VLDVDGPEGRESLQGLSLPPTITAETGGGGLHYWYRLPEGVRVENTVRLAPGLDVRTKGCYVVAPPSVHRSGARYRWADCCAPEDVTIADAPAWLLDLIATRPRAPRPPLRPRGGETIPEGRRNVTLFRHGCRLRADGADERAIRGELLDLNDARCDPPLEVGEVRRIAASAARYPPGPVRVDNRLLNADLSDGAILLGALLALTGGRSDLDIVAELTGVTVRTVRRWRAELREAGLLDIGRPTRRYTLVPAEVLISSELSVGARVLYMTIARLSGEGGRTQVGQEALAKRLGVTCRSVRRCLAELEGAGLLTVSRASYQADCGRRLRCNRYRLRDTQTLVYQGLRGEKRTPESYSGPWRGHQSPVVVKAVPPSPLEVVEESLALGAGPPSAPQGAGRRDCAVKRGNGSEESLVPLPLEANIYKPPAVAVGGEGAGGEPPVEVEKLPNVDKSPRPVKKLPVCAEEALRDRLAALIDAGDDESALQVFRVLQGEEESLGEKPPQSALVALLAQVPQSALVDLVEEALERPVAV
jgi:DNA-binding IscR family transcriptional regulator